jgi:hypothetical protein
MVQCEELPVMENKAENRELVIDGKRVPRTEGDI